MALYPTNIPQEDRDENFHAIARDARVYNFPWGKKIYGYHEGKLTAIIPLALDFYITKRGGCYAYPRLWAKVAGKGECFYPNDTFYATIDDYYNNKPMTIVASKIENEINYCGYKTEYDSLSSIRISGYMTSMWSTTPSNHYMEIHHMWYDADGLHIEFKKSNSVFLTYNEALAKMKENTDVLDFGDDELVDEKKEFSVEISLSIKAISKNVAKEQVIESLAKMGYKIELEK